MLERLEREQVSSLSARTGTWSNKDWFLITIWYKSGNNLVTIWYNLVTVPEPSRIYEEWIGGIQLQEEDNVRWIHPH